MQQLLVMNIFASISKMQYLINKKDLKSLLDWPRKFFHIIILPDFKVVQSSANCDKAKKFISQKISRLTFKELRCCHRTGDY